MSLLRLEALSKKFGDHWALKEIDFSIGQGEIIGLVGPNGAGKTTLFNLITGRHRPNSGRVFFADKDITSCRPHEIQRLGISRTFQSSRPFAKMNALENVVVGCVFRAEFHLFTRDTDIDTAKQLLELVGLSHKAVTPAGDLTLSEQRRLDLARALATQPRLLLLDEVVAGFSPLAVKQAAELVRRVRERGVTLFIIDHFLSLSLRVSDRLLALDHGEKVAEGNPREVMRNREVIRAYLGMRHEEGQHGA
ncbi:MAG: ABC transporter ATP-binding protein [Deltaproteobacteria bacterium]|nr:ABC transporter ATP-binding protein [Deltaproteobacteria bacterium]